MGRRGSKDSYCSVCEEIKRQKRFLDRDLRRHTLKHEDTYSRDESSLDFNPHHHHTHEDYLDHDHHHHHHNRHHHEHERWTILPKPDSSRKAGSSSQRKHSSLRQKKSSTHNRNERIEIVIKQQPPIYQPIGRSVFDSSETRRSNQRDESQIRRSSRDDDDRERHREDDDRPRDERRTSQRDEDPPRRSSRSRDQDDRDRDRRPSKQRDQDTLRRSSREKEDRRRSDDSAKIRRILEEHQVIRRDEEVNQIRRVSRGTGTPIAAPEVENKNPRKLSDRGTGSNTVTQETTPAAQDTTTGAAAAPATQVIYGEEETWWEPQLSEPGTPYSAQESENDVEPNQRSADPDPICWNCHVGRFVKKFTWSGIVAALICFPCGIYACFKLRVKICSYCGIKESENKPPDDKGKENNNRYQKK